MNLSIKGKLVDDSTRCEHYHSPVDIIAIRFKCCGEYYPCYQCHLESAGHTARVWPREEFESAAILCGICRHEMSILKYKACNNQCPSCGAAFNPGCRQHYHLYFEE